MDYTNIKVENKDYIKTSTITNLNMKIASLILNTSVQVLAVAVDTEGNYVYNEVINIEGEDYKNWGSDDTYLENFVLAKLGLTKKDVTNS